MTLDAPVVSVLLLHERVRGGQLDVLQVELQWERRQDVASCWVPVSPDTAALGQPGYQAPGSPGGRSWCVAHSLHMADDRDKKTGRFVKGASGNPTGLPAPRRDGWMSALTGIGTHTYDKRTSHHFQARQITYVEAIEMWRGDDLAARAIESVPSECFRQGYEISIADEGRYDDLKESVEERMQELRVDELVEKAFQYERAFGGGAILLGVSDGKALNEPMKPSEVSGIDWLTVLEPIEIMPFSSYQDVTAPKYGEVEFYQLATHAPSAGVMPAGTPRSAASQPTQLIHESRLIVFPGIRVSRYQHNTSVAGHLWGDSILTRLTDVLRDFNIAWQAAGIIVTDFSQAVFSMENLLTLVGRDEQKLIDRMRALEMSRSTARAILIDTKESFKRESTSVAGLPDLLDRLSSRLSAAIDMPLTLLMGQSPKGLGNEGDSDVRFYYDRIQSVQERRVGPILRLIAQMIMQSIRKRKLPKKWGIRFHPLWQLTDKEEADARLSQARVDSMYVKMGAVDPNEIRQSRFGGEYSFQTQIDESKDAPGFVALPPKGVGSIGPDGQPVPPAPAGAAGHEVGGYVRRNPAGGGHGADENAAPQGGDTAPAHRDAEPEPGDQG